MSVEGENGGTTLGITVEHTVWCSQCCEWNQQPINTKREMAKFAKQQGWALRRGKWLCPECSDK